MLRFEFVLGSGWETGMKVGSGFGGVAEEETGWRSDWTSQSSDGWRVWVLVLGFESGGLLLLLRMTANGELLQLQSPSIPLREAAGPEGGGYV